MRALIITHDVMEAVTSKLRGILRAQVDSQGPATATFDNVDHALYQVQPEMVVVVLSPDPDKGLEALQKIRRESSSYLLAAGQASEPKLILRALHSGADQYLDETELEAGLDSVLARLQIKQEASSPPGRLLGILAASGGSGASTLAVNIAVALAKDHQKSALIDLKPGIGDLAALLDLKPQFTLADLCLNLSRLDRAMFEKMLVRHSSGVHLLGSPQVFGNARVVTTQGVNQALTMARKMFAHVVVDLEDCFHEEQIITLRQAAGILVIFRLDFTSLRNARRILEQLKDLEIPRSRVRLVVNRHGLPYELPLAEAEQALGEKLVHFIPDDPKTLNRSNNAGIPVVLKNPTARVSRSIVELAKIAFSRASEETTSSSSAPAQAAVAMASS
jgi:pilus assembly protein CpaE